MDIRCGRIQRRWKLVQNHIVDFHLLILIACITKDTAKKYREGLVVTDENGNPVGCFHEESGTAIHKAASNF